MSSLLKVVVGWTAASLAVVIVARKVADHIRRINQTTIK